MLGMLLALWALAAGPGPDDPAALAARLASARAADRDEAAAALLRLGDAALPALREARQSTDLEARERSASLIDAIEARALAEPTRVALDFRDRPLAEVARAIGDRAGIRLVLPPGPGQQPVDPAAAATRVTLESGGPVPFWEAVDRLCRAAGLAIEPDDPMSRRRWEPPPAPGWTGPVLRLGRAGPARPPSVTEGAFRVEMLGLHRSRDVRFAPGAGGAPPVEDRVVARLRVLADPGRAILRVGRPTAVEARDDRGQDLRPSGGEPGAFDQADPGAAALALAAPERAGRSIAVLRGAFPVRVAARRPGPLVLPLDGSPGRIVADEGVALAVRAVERRPDGSARVELAVLPRGANATFLGMLIPWSVGPDGGGVLGHGAVPGTEGQVVVLDAEGRRCPSTVGPPGSGPDGVFRVAVGVQAIEGAGPPDRLVYHGMVWGDVSVPFEFRDLPMP